MKAVGGVVAVGAVGIVLQGCGGGEAEPVKCFNDKMNIVSQSIEATSVTTMDQTVIINEKNGKGKGTITGTSTEKMNVKDFNAFFEVDGTTVTTLGDKENDFTSWQRMVINADKQEVVVWQKMTLATINVTVNNCTIMPMPIPKEQLKQMYSQYLVMLQSNMTCASNDGTFDTFHGEVDMSMPPMKMSMKYSTNIQMDKDSLMGGTSTVTGTTKGDTQTMDIEYTETATKAVAGGPSSDDLDWSKWGVECKKTPMPPTPPPTPPPMPPTPSPSPPPPTQSTPRGPAPSSMVKFALDAKQFKPGAIHFFSQVFNIDTPAIAHEKSKVVVV
jgi:hypothetical protein